MNISIFKIYQNPYILTSYTCTGPSRRDAGQEVEGLGANKARSWEGKVVVGTGDKQGKTENEVHQ